MAGHEEAKRAVRAERNVDSAPKAKKRNAR
jgi:hypothetical protein